MTRLRTIWGIPFSIFSQDSASRFTFSNLLKEKSKRFVEEEFLEWKNDSLILSDRGKLIADKIILELMFEAEVN